MKFPEVPLNETERLVDLETYSILDTLPEKEYDDIAKIAAEICQTPVSLISMIDSKRQWYKSNLGLEMEKPEVARELTFCAHVLNKPEEVLEVPDSRLDERFFDNPFVTNAPYVVFYASVPLISPKGNALGTLCVIDYKPKKLSKSQLDALTALSSQIMSIMELRKHKNLLEKHKEELEARNQALDAFARIVAHDIKSPLANIAGLSQLLTGRYAKGLDITGLNMLQMIDTSALKVIGLVDGILEYSKSMGILQEMKSYVDLHQLVGDIVDLVGHQGKVLLPSESHLLLVNKVALQQIFLNLISNAIKYNDKENTDIEINFEEEQDAYRFAVKDNGIGIAENDLVKIFEMFEVIALKDKDGHRGNGIGLSTVKKLVQGMGGDIQVSSELGKGSKFEFTIAK